MSSKYDAVIIGAGVGGITAGCYLAKARKKVLVVEQHSVPGGCCSSFNREGYRFDVGVHYLGGVERDFFKEILEDIGLRGRLHFNRFDPYDKIIFPDIITYISSDIGETIANFQKNFPTEKENISSFFDFILQDNFFEIYKKVKAISLRTLLNDFFLDYRLIAIIESLIYNIGVSGRECSALAAVVLYRDYILEGGYYPSGGMQGFVDVIVARYLEYGGDLILGKKVKRIVCKNQKIVGVLLDDTTYFETNLVVSNGDATQTFQQLLEGVEATERGKLDWLKPSPSIFAVYLGMQGGAKQITNEICNIWSFKNYQIDENMLHLGKDYSDEELPYVLLTFPSSREIEAPKQDKYTLQLFTLASYGTKEYWDDNRDAIVEKMVKHAEGILPDLRSYINTIVSATPRTLERYTLNKDGACFGWKSTIQQLRPRVFPPKTSIKNLYLVGHWCTIGSGQGGVPKVMVSAKKVSELILKEC